MAGIERNPSYIQKQRLTLTTPGNEQSDLPTQYQQARSIIESHIGSIRHTDVVAGGLVSHVYRVAGEKKKGIVKVRGTHLAKLPHIPIDAKDIDYEWDALQILYGVEPSTFPQPLAMDRETSMILMTDIFPDKKTLEQRLETQEASAEEMRTLGNTIARVHKKLAPIEMNIRKGGDEEVYQSDLRRRVHQIEKRDPILNNVVTELIDEHPKQLILGDLSPKNIGKSGEQVTICDVESFYRGNLLFAYGYLAGHILIHTMDDFDKANAFMSNLLAGYQEVDKHTDFDSSLLKRITLGSALYRIDNTTVPYNLSMNYVEKQKKASAAYDLLIQPPTWKELTKKMTNR